MFRLLFALAALALISGQAGAQTDTQGTPPTPGQTLQVPAELPPPVWPEKGSTKTGKAIAWDGDTIEIDGQSIRLHGIDSPEMRGDPRGPVARGALDDILAPDPTTTCEALSMDRHKRPVARCRAGGRDIAEAMVLGGWAFSFRKYSTNYDKAEAEARAEGRGFWGENTLPCKPGWLSILQALTPFVAVFSAAATIAAGFIIYFVRRCHNRRDVATAIGSEFEALLVSAWGVLEDYDKDKAPTTTAALVLRKPHFQIFKATADRLGLLGLEKSREVVEIVERMRMRWVDLTDILGKPGPAHIDPIQNLRGDLAKLKSIRDDLFAIAGLEPIPERT